MTHRLASLCCIRVATGWKPGGVWCSTWKVFWLWRDSHLFTVVCSQSVYVKKKGTWVNWMMGAVRSGPAAGPGEGWNGVKAGEACSLHTFACLHLRSRRYLGVACWLIILLLRPVWLPNFISSCDPGVVQGQISWFLDSSSSGVYWCHDSLLEMKSTTPLTVISSDCNTVAPHVFYLFATPHWTLTITQHWNAQLHNRLPL